MKYKGTITKAVYLYWNEGYLVNFSFSDGDCDKSAFLSKEFFEKNKLKIGSIVEFNCNFGVPVKIKTENNGCEYIDIPLK